MRTLIVLTLLLSSSWPALALPAQEAFDPAALAKAVAPYIDQQTVGVAHLRATRIQVDSVIDEWIRLLPAWGYELSKLRAPLQRVHDAVLQSRFDEIYIVISLADFRAGGQRFSLAACHRPASRSWASDYPKRQDTIERLGDLVFIGWRTTFERLRALKPDTRRSLPRHLRRPAIRRRRS